MFILPPAVNCTVLSISASDVMDYDFTIIVMSFINSFTFGGRSCGMCVHLSLLPPPFSLPPSPPSPPLLSLPSLQVCTTGSLLVEFSPEDKPRIVSWYFIMQDHQEFVSRNSLAGIVVSS